MGNQLAGIAPSQILSVDSYFTDITEYEYDRNLGSTRFFKVMATAAARPLARPLLENVSLRCVFRSYLRVILCTV